MNTNPNSTRSTVPEHRWTAAGGHRPRRAVARATVALLTLVTTVLVGRSPAAEAGCAVPATANVQVTRTVHAVGTSMGVSPRVMLAAFEAGWVESHMNNLSCGDRDSLGVFQQRSSWGSRSQRLDPTYAATKFFERAKVWDGRLPSSVSAGTLAQKVQVSAYPKRYDAAEGQARGLLAQARGGLIANLTTCGALYVKTTYWGDWQQLLGCGQARGVDVAPDGQTVAVIRSDNTLIAKRGLGAPWETHTGSGDARATSAGPNGMLANVNGCGALYIKTSYWGTWQQHMGCGQVRSVSIGPDGQLVAAIQTGNTLIAKRRLSSTWDRHAGIGTSVATSVA